MDNNNIGAPAITPIDTNDPLALAKEIVRTLDLKKGRDIRLLHVADQTVIADYFVICGGTSNTNIKGLAGECEYKIGLHGLEPLRMDGFAEGSWVVIDYGSVLVHIMNRDSREFFRLEKLWSEAEELDISDLIIAD